MLALAWRLVPVLVGDQHPLQVGLLYFEQRGECLCPIVEEPPNLRRPLFCSRCMYDRDLTDKAFVAWKGGG
jgi:hypothetical protein